MGIGAKIGEVAKEKGISLKELSRKINIPYTTLYHAVKRDSKIEYEIIQYIVCLVEERFICTTKIRKSRLFY